MRIRLPKINRQESVDVQHSSAHSSEQVAVPPVHSGSHTDPHEASLSAATTRPWWRAAWFPTVALVLILLLGMHFRTLGLLTWDAGTGQHPDERFFTDVASLIRIPSDPAEYFDSVRSPANPRNVGKTFYVYGSLPIGMTRLVAVMLTPPEAMPDTVPAIGQPEQQVPNPELRVPRLSWLHPIVNPDGLNLTAYHQIYRVGRSLAMLFDLGSILLVFLIGRRLFDRRVGLLAALLSALAVMSIQQSHFFVDPIFSTFFTVLALYWAVRVAQDGRVTDYVFLGLSIGLGMSSRITLATLGLVALVAAVLAALPRRESAGSAAGQAGAPSFAARFFKRELLLLCLAGALTLFTFRVFQPDAFIGSTPTSPAVPSAHAPPLPFMHGWGFFDVRPDPRFLQNMQEVSGFVSGEIDFYPSQQWVRRPAYLFPWKNMVLWGMGPALGLVVWLGWAALGGRLLLHLRARLTGRHAPLFSSRSLAVLVPWIWVTFYFAWQGRQFATTMRYMLPIYGALIIFGAWLLVALWDWSRHRRLDQAGDPARPWWRRWHAHGLRGAGRWSLVLVVLATLGWAYAFTRVYTRPHSRVMAARWVLTHVPPGAAIAAEEWDDALPLAVDGGDPWRTTYRGITMRPYGEDDPAKYTGSFNAENEYSPGLLDQLEQADYITLTSNRVYDSTSRLPMRYPALMRYYHHLFSGELGFELAAEVTSYPRFLGFSIPDQGAEEAFTVYDHPRVLIFRKTPDFSREQAEALITEDVNWDEVYKLPVSVADRTDTALRLTESAWPAYRAAGTWSAMFGPAGLVNRLAPLIWLVTLELIGLAAFALLFRLFPWLPDRGFALARTLALLFVAYAAWLLGSMQLLPFSGASVWLAALPLLAGGAWVAWRARADLRAFWAERRTALLTAEAVYLGAFLLLLAIRWLNPDLWHPARGGEKPMDFAYLNAVLKSAAFPPYDPWFAGGYINYYYFGFVFVGALIHLTRVEPAIAYNLAVPTLFALAALGAWGVVYNLLAPLAGRRRARPDAPELPPEEAELPGDGEAPVVSARSEARDVRRAITERRARFSALLAPVFLLLLGNLAQAIWYLNGYAAEQVHRPEWAFWDATRIVAGTVNEFPFFTFLFADLHAHMIAIPLALAMLGLTVALARWAALEPPPAQSWRAWLSPHRLAFGALLLLLAWLAGTLRATNTWDYPTYVALTVATLGAVFWWRFHRRHAPTDGWAALRFLLTFVASAAAVVLVGNLLFWPFIRDFVTESSGAALWREGLRTSLAEQVIYAERTSLWDLLRLYGHWLFLISGAGLWLAYRRRLVAPPVLAGVAVVLLLLVVLGVRFDWPALVLLLPLLLGAALLLWRLRYAPPRVLLPLLWAGLALSLALMVELVVVRGDIGRMNTVFKFGIHIWTLLALTSAVALPWMWWSSAAWRAARQGGVASLRPLRAAARLWSAAAVLLLLAGLVYPLTATPARIGDRYAGDLPRTLDGARFMRFVSGSEQGREFPLHEDAAAITWLQQNVQGTPLILEAHQPAYHWAGRVATYTGLPTLLGWEWHQIQQRNAVQAAPIIQHRQQLIAEIYNTLDSSRALQHLYDYGIEYVYVGGVEHALYDPAGLAKFAQLARQGRLDRVFTSGDTSIYRVRQPGEPTMLTTDLPIQPPVGNTPPPLMLDQPVGQLPVVHGYAWNSWASAGIGLSVLVWLAALYGLALLGLPLALVLFGGWHDAGFAWARLVGLLLLGYAVWLPTSLELWQYDAVGLLGGLVLVLALNVALLAWMGRRAPTEQVPAGFGAALRHGLRQAVALVCARWPAILVSEGVFLAGFALFVLFRAFNPDLWHPVWGGEKPMEFGFLNAILRSPVMPPFDPFFSGGYINYYYYGLYLVSLPIKITGIDPAVAFNLVVPTLFGLTLVGGFAIVTRLTGRQRYGLLGAAFVAVLGNLAALFPVGWSRGLQPVVAALWRDGPAGLAGLGDWYVGPSRVIDPPHTINEFPFWSFLFADLHPHMIALPITLLVVALAWELLRQTVSGLRREQIPLLGFTALALGTLAVTNSWDFPTYTLLIGAALVGAAWRATRTGIAWGHLLRAMLLAAGLALGGMLLYAPFFDHFYALVSGVGVVRDSTTLPEYVVLYGLFLAVLVPVLLAAAWRVVRLYRRASLPEELPAGAQADTGEAPTAPLPEGASASTLEDIGTAPTAPLPEGAPTGAQADAGEAPVAPSRRRLPLRRGYGTALLVAGGLLLVVLAIALPVVGLRLWLGLLLVVGIALLVQRRLAPATWFVFLLATLGWAVSLGIETLYIRDHLASGDAYRMNTVFKFGLQIWVLLALAAAASLPHLLHGLRRAGGRPAQFAGLVCLSWLLAATAIFPLVGPAVRIANRFPVELGPTLDGLAFLEQARFDYACDGQPGCERGVDQVRVDLQPDAAAIAWLKQHLSGSPVVLQSNLWFYRAYGVRVAANTGFPTVVSALHVDEQRDPALAHARNRDVDLLFRTTDIETTLRLLAKYRVEYIYVGAVEHAFYNEAGLNKFATMSDAYLDVVYDQPGVQIYAVREIPPRYAEPEQAEFVPDEPPPPPPPEPDPDTGTAQEPAPAEPQPVPPDLQDWEDRLATSPSDALLAFGLAERYRELNRLEDAARVLAVAAEANPDDVPLHHLWGDVLSQLGRYTDAEKAYLQAARSQSTAGNWNKLGTALLEWGELDKAEIALEQAVSVDANAAEPHYRLGQLYHRRGDDERAIRELERYLALDPTGLYSAEVQQLLDTIRSDE